MVPTGTQGTKNGKSKQKDLIAEKARNLLEYIPSMYWMGPATHIPPPPPLFILYRSVYYMTIIYYCIKAIELQTLWKTIAESQPRVEL